MTSASNVLATTVGTTPAAIEARAVSVQYGAFQALSDVSLAWLPGTINVVVGQNGAGKTTLARVLGGLQHPSHGGVLIGGEELGSADVVAARSRGVEIVHQHFALPSSFTVAQALELFSAERRPGGVFTRRALRADATRQLAVGDLDLSPDAKVGDLPVETQQALEITRALASKPSVLVLDEPTAVLSPQAVERLFDRVRALARAGICVILVLHKLGEVFGVAETISVLREGRLILPPTPAESLDRRTVSSAIIGDAVVPVVDAPPPPKDQPALLRLCGVTASGSRHDHSIEEVDLEILPGEIVGIAGVEGNGQRNLVETIVGVVSVQSGALELDGVSLGGVGVRQRRAHGLRTIPFERNTEGASKSSTLWENHAMLRHSGDGFFFSPRRAKRACAAALDRWRVKYLNVDQRPSELSGGNVQKTILAREIAGDVRCLIAAHPTRGLDLAATESVRQAVTEAAADGTAVLLVSADLDELFQLSHRVVVLCAGRVSGEFTAPWDRDAVGWAMTGGEHE
ncbi:ATP-binding cassette domain-containing protein [Microbacterium sp. Root180]|uniref:ATP-binding cassette domain-containing protein n=1 Tax=Microbacterium sp. Root180 TaxID=1736483 RepID=UPI0006F2276A|nr:ATP-binding cassette domain-containing protein [Microbacterium sp. Root180]KRB36636.1 hypothetical protein ASD93_11320 [Microbacterium sp. Root180]